MVFQLTTTKFSYLFDDECSQEKQLNSQVFREHCNYHFRSTLGWKVQRDLGFINAIKLKFTQIVQVDLNGQHGS